MAEDFVFGPAETTEAVVEARIARLRGVSHAHRIEPRDPEPLDDVTLWVTVGPDVDADDVWVYYTTDGSDPAGSGGSAQNGSAVRFVRESVGWDDLVWGFVTTLVATIPGQADGVLVRYTIEVAGRTIDGGEGSATRTPYFAYAVDTWRTPDWARDAVMYYVMPDRFHPGPGRDWIQTEDNAVPMGGTLAGIRHKLDYIQEMGFTALWLMPWMTGPTYHKYGATDFWAVDPDFGTEQDLRDLIDDAHGRGMRVLVDFVANHCSDEHPYFRAALQDPSSPYRSWFTFDDDGGYLSFFGGGELPHLRHDNPETRAFVLDLARSWVRDLGIDGYDLDYAIGPTHEFWAEFGRAVREVGPEVVVFTEGVTTPEALLGYVGRVDGSQDFAWCQAARRTFGNHKMDVAQFERFLSAGDHFFPDGFIAPIMLDNQNMDRFLLVADGDQRKLRLAAACQYSMSRPLSVWAGTEMGMGQRDPATHDLNSVRDVTAWDAQDARTTAMFRRLGALRAEHPALGRGERVPVIADATTGLLVYEKRLGDDLVVVVLNASDHEQEVDVGYGDLVDLLENLVPADEQTMPGDGRLKAGAGSTRITMAPWSPAYLVPVRA